MKILKSKKGISLITLMIYMVLTAMVLSILAIITRNFRQNLNNVKTDTVVENEFDKINLQILNETMKEDNEIVSTTNTRVEFSSGTIFKYDKNEKILYLKKQENDVEIKIAEGITELSFSSSVENDKKILNVRVVIEGKQRTKEYVMSKSINEEQNT